ncbi:MAG TPA: hypothetical protein VK337_17430 [Xanthobacteraceae bacterium]|nr:hypothetical protein [Xanthobacteraceae bacterium]
MNTMARGSFLRVSLIGCSLLLVSASWAATIEPVQGNLSLNRGQGFQPINGRVDANVGDTVVVGPGGAAAVTYSDGCKVSVQPGSVTTIAPLSPCASGSMADDNNNNSNGLYFLGVAAGFGLAGFGIYEIIHHNNNNSSTEENHPISP